MNLLPREQRFAEQTPEWERRALERAPKVWRMAARPAMAPVDLIVARRPAKKAPCARP
jgi:hypothetical protein